MDSQPSTAIPRPTGIPRLSKLPVLKNKPSLTSLGTSEQDVKAVQRPSSTVPRVQKVPAAAATSSRSMQLPVKPSPSLPNTAFPRNNVTTGSKGAPKASTTTVSSRNAAARPPSRNKQGLAPRPAPTKPSKALEDEENHDQVTSPDSFRSASRQDFHDDSHTDSGASIAPMELVEIPDARKKSRPSLSDRTMESLQNLPSTPKERRRSSFFSPIESPMGPPPRLASSHSRNGSRPGTSDGSFARPPPAEANGKKVSASAKPASRSSIGGFGFTPNSAAKGVGSGAMSSRAESGVGAVREVPRSPSPSKKAAAPPSVAREGASHAQTASARKPIAAKAKKPRPRVSDAFRLAVKPAAGQNEAQTPSQSPIASKATTGNVSSPPNASSTALRQQIAAAKAAARKEKAKVDSPLDTTTTYTADLHQDPFNHAPKDTKHILRNRIKSARMDGKLNIAAMGLKQIPDEVMHMYDATAMEESKVSWAEVVDLTRLNAADNEIEEIAEDIFPDKGAEDFVDDELTEGNQFGGLESLDLHGNKLVTIPVGLRRLERLTKLELSYNKLENAALDVISQIASLKELRLGHNGLSGTLPASICGLNSLEVLDLQANRLLGLPEALRELVSLRALNVAENQLTALPMDAIQELRLMELDASGNALIGSLFPTGTLSGHATLQSLKVANNSLAALTFDEMLKLPQLRTLDVTNNRLTALPRLGDCKEVITIMAGDNKIRELPQDFSSLPKLRNANFTSNEMRLLDPEIGKMENLESLILASNPLREKKFLRMNAADIKRDLRARLEPEHEAEGRESLDSETFHDARDRVSPTPRSPSSSWVVKAKGVLDLSDKGYSDAIGDSLGSFFTKNEVKHLDMHANQLLAIPMALSLDLHLRTLDLSGNTLAAQYLAEDLTLPSLQELNLSRCAITALEPLTTHIHAPTLQTLTITANRLSGPLPHLRSAFPALTTLLAADNKYTSITADSLRGLHTVNLASNCIEVLPAEIGLLWDEGLRGLEVGSNAFRVPGYRVLEKGTEATMRWLRDKLPAPVLSGEDEVD